MEQHRLRRRKGKVECEIARGDARQVLPSGQRERPVGDCDRGRLFACLGETESRTGSPLIVAQPRMAHVRNRGMREQQLPWREAAGIGLGDARADCGRT